MEFSLFERERRSVPPGPTTEPFFLYGDAWKKFDKLEKVAEPSVFGWINHIFDLILIGSLLIWGHVDKKYSAVIIALYFLGYAFALMRFLAKKKEFLHWPCPRCHSVWPGDKTGKDSKCNACGLRLHQLNP